MRHLCLSPASALFLFVEAGSGIPTWLQVMMSAGGAAVASVWIASRTFTKTALDSQAALQGIAEMKSDQKTLMERVGRLETERAVTDTNLSNLKAEVYDLREEVRTSLNGISASQNRQEGMLSALLQQNGRKDGKAA